MNDTKKDAQYCASFLYSSQCDEVYISVGLRSAVARGRVKYSAEYFTCAQKRHTEKLLLPRTSQELEGVFEILKDDVENRLTLLWRDDCTRTECRLVACRVG